MKELEKLIKLLNEFEDEGYEDEFKEEYIDDLFEYSYYEPSKVWKYENGGIYFNGANSVQFPKQFFVPVIISKQYGFIDWLIQKDKIETDFDDEEGLVMQLAISDTPIKDLLKLLK